MSVSLRRELGLTRTGPLSTKQLAEYLDVRLLTLYEIDNLDPRDTHTLLISDPDAWSALTVSAEGRDAIVVNSTHTGGRPSSDVMHELAHLLLGHEPGALHFTADAEFAMRRYRKDDEDEATWLAGCLLLPRDTLVEIKRMGKTIETVCIEYAVSPDMLIYRNRMTGIDRQFGGRS
jgi:Zn-dependent peptidase ImmA (M78 family)